MSRLGREFEETLPEIAYLRYLIKKQTPPCPQCSALLSLVEILHKALYEKRLEEWSK